MSQQAILRPFCNQQIGFRGTVQECDLTDQLLQKWDRPVDKFKWATMQEVETKLAAFMAEVMRRYKFKAPEQNG